MPSVTALCTGVRDTDTVPASRDLNPHSIDDDELPDPDRLRECEYWRCGDLFEQRTGNQIFCRKACRSRQRKWERAQVRAEERARRRAEAKAARAAKRR